MSRLTQKNSGRTYFKTGNTTLFSDQLPPTNTAKKPTIKKKKLIKPGGISKKENKVLKANFSNKNKLSNIDPPSTAFCKNRIGSNKRNNRNKMLQNLQTPTAVLHNTSRNSQLSGTSRERIGSNNSRIGRKNKTTSAGGINNANFNPRLNKGLITQLGETELNQVPSQPQIPIITRQLVSNTAHTSSKHSRIENSISPTKPNNPTFERSHTQVKLKKGFNTASGTRLNSDIPSQRVYTDNIVRANSEISMLRKELQMKNKELMKLKKLGKLPNKCKTPHTDVDQRSPSSNLSTSRRTVLKSRAKTGEGRKVSQIGGHERSNSQSDEYYETTKHSPTASFTTSVYSKGIPQIKSSQSCRQKKQDQTPGSYQANNL